MEIMRLEGVWRCLEVMVVRQVDVVDDRSMGLFDDDDVSRVSVDILTYVFVFRDPVVNELLDTVFWRSLFSCWRALELIRVQ